MKIAYWYLENTYGNHNKFYLCGAREDGTVGLLWGKIGSAGQTNEYAPSPPTWTSAIHECQRKVASKLKGGYDLIVSSEELEVELAAPWATAFFESHGGTRKQITIAPVSCTDCGAGGWDLTGWAAGASGLVCKDCQ